MLVTVTPPTRAGATLATGVTTPVRPTWYSMAFNRVRCRGGGYLYALAHRGERVTLPNTACKRRSSTLITAPSIS